MLLALTTAVLVVGVALAEVALVQSRYAILISANSQSSTLYIYEYTMDLSVGAAVPQIIQTSAPTTQPISDFIGNVQNIQLYFNPLIEFARQELQYNQSLISEIPIFFKASGVMRLMANESSYIIMQQVISVLSDSSFCPFFFYPGFAHIMSGTEQAAAAWTSANIFQNVDLARLGYSYVDSKPATYGVIDIGATSTQIAFAPVNMAVLDNTFTVNLGMQSLWQIYATSYLDLGYSQALALHLQGLADEFYAVPDSAVVPTMLDYCFYSGYTENVENTNGTLNVQIWGPAVPAGNQLDLCIDVIESFLFAGSNKFCETAYPEQCAFGDRYQPPVQHAEVIGFIGMSALQFSWIYLNLPSVATIQDFINAAYPLCSMSFSDAMSYYENNPSFIQIPGISENLPHFCFINSYVISVLTTGLGFSVDQELLVQISNDILSWEAGSIMMDINILPVNSVPVPPNTSSDKIWTYIFLAGNIGIIVGLIAACSISRILFADSTRGKIEVVAGGVSVVQKPVSQRRKLYDDIEESGLRSSQVEPSTSWTSMISQYSPFGSSSKRDSEKQYNSLSATVNMSESENILSPIADKDKTMKTFQYYS